ncbi:hypothetical protein AGLY_013175 [Aphis glycines]|uniref:Uncharacterized protein n=1 Tax=Aphis glycines TaxID=307491 RepID=A0A6G0T5R2_APHGL|nr:hypothetical protein AGLY_013175 [Aphis glycines]
MQLTKYTSSMSMFYRILLTGFKIFRLVEGSVVSVAPPVKLIEIGALGSNLIDEPNVAGVDVVVTLPKIELLAPKTGAVLGKLLLPIIGEANDLLSLVVDPNDSNDRLPTDLSSFLHPTFINEFELLLLLTTELYNALGLAFSFMSLTLRLLLWFCNSNVFSDSSFLLFTNDLNSFVDLSFSILSEPNLNCAIGLLVEALCPNLN